MKKIISVCLTILMVALLFSSCSTTDNVANNSFVQKRKYAKGFYRQQSGTNVAKIEHDKKSKLADSDIEHTATATEETAQTEEIVSASPDASTNYIKKSKPRTESTFDKGASLGYNIFEAPFQLPKIKSKKAKENASILSPKSDINVVAIIGFIFSLLSIITIWFIPVVPALLALLGIIFSGFGMRHDGLSGLSIAGLVLGILTLLIYFAIFLVLFILLSGL
jgi:cobalamin biosynthesis Mg chelatase CobN